MTKIVFAFGPFDEEQPTLAAAVAGVDGELRLAATVADLGLAQLPHRPDAILLRLDSAHLEEFATTLHTHPKLEGVPLLAILPQLTQSAAVRATSLGADDFLALDDLPGLLPSKLAAATRDAAERPRPQQCKVLVADASPLHGRVLTRLLSEAGFAVVPVTSAAAIGEELAGGRGYGLLVIDLDLVDGDPAGFIARARLALGEAMPPAIAMIHPGVEPATAAAAAGAGFRHLHDKRRAPDELVFLAHEASVTDHAKLRSSPRLLCAVLVGFRRPEGRWEYGLSQNLSLSGLYVRTIDPPQPGLVIDLDFTPPGCDDPIQARGQVMWRKDFAARAVRASPTGMGLKLVDPDESVQRGMALAARALSRQGPTGR
jgi:CheY-like chemotaxis protein